MGYTTTFSGEWTCTPALTEAQTAYLNAFSDSRRMKRDASKLTGNVNDAARLAVGLPVGPEGAYVVNDDGNFGQTKDQSIIDFNEPPSGQPGLWCQWVPSEDGTSIGWNDAEKFYDYVTWIEYIIDNFLHPWGVKLDGKVTWQGEETDDHGIILITANKVVSFNEGVPAETLDGLEMQIQYAISELGDLVKASNTVKASSHELVAFRHKIHQSLENLAKLIGA